MIIARMIRIYTRTGDKARSSLFSGERRSKADPVFEALGSTDELNASIGFSKQALVHKDLVDMLETIQCRLLDLGSCLASPGMETMDFSAHNTEKLEAWIDSLDSELDPLKNFILPGGGEASSRLHLARTVCRKAERSVATLMKDSELNTKVYSFLNRLSDLLFVMARIAAKRDGRPDDVYKKEQS